MRRSACLIFPPKVFAGKCTVICTGFVIIKKLVGWNPDHFIRNTGDSRPATAFPWSWIFRKELSADAKTAAGVGCGR